MRSGSSLLDSPIHAVPSNMDIDHTWREFGARDIPGPPVRNFDCAGARHFPRGDWLSQMQLTFRLSRKIHTFHNYSHSQEIAGLSLHYSSAGVKRHFSTDMRKLLCPPPPVPQFWFHRGGWQPPHFFFFSFLFSFVGFWCFINSKMFRAMFSVYLI